MNTHDTVVDDQVLRIREELNVHGFILLSDHTVDLGSKDRQQISTMYFDDRCLEADVHEVHTDRKRSRDVVRYIRHGSRIALSENPEIAIVGRSGHAGVRRPRRVHVLADPKLERLTAHLLSYIPINRQDQYGTFGLNFFQTRTRVVSKPHQDDEQFCIIYVVDMHGWGAETELRAVGDPDGVFFRHALQPGEILIFDDRRFLHYTSPIDGPKDRYRNALVCTVDDAGTYSASPEWVVGARPTSLRRTVCKSKTGSISP